MRIPSLKPLLDHHSPCEPAADPLGPRTAEREEDESPWRHRGTLPGRNTTLMAPVGPRRATARSAAG